MKTKQLFKILTMFTSATISIGCSQQFSFKEVQKSCTPAPSSARNGENKGPIITSPAPGTPFNGTMTLSGTCEPGYAVTIAGSGVSDTVNTACTNAGTFSANVSFVSGDGQKEVDVSQPTAEGGLNITDRLCFALDTVPPQVVISGGNGTQSIGSTTVRIEGTCESGLNVIIEGPQLADTITTACNNGRFVADITFNGGDGLKDVVARQEDPAGNEGQDDKEYMADLTAPAITISSPAVNFLTTGNITLTGTCEVGPPVVIQGAGMVGVVSAVCNAGSYSSPITLSGIDGVKNIVAAQTDAGGNTGSANRNFVKDATAPLIRILTPVANYLSTGAITLTGSCETGLNVNLSGDGLAAPVNTACAGSAFSANLNLVAPDGVKNIIARQTDAAGNVGQDARAFMRDATAPLLTIDQPAANSTWLTGVTLQGQCETGLPVQLSGAGISAAMNANCVGNTYSIALLFSAGDGVKNIIARQVDAIGNTTTVNRNFNRDSSPPTVTITSPANNAYVANTALIRGTCENGLAVLLNGAGVQTPQNGACNSNQFAVTVTFTAGDGNKEVRASQTDGVGNTTTDTKTYIKDLTAPVVVITAPAANTVAPAGVTLQGTCETGLTVNLSGAGLSGPASTACAAGAFNVAITFTAVDGIKNIIASQTDAAGNTGTDNRSFVRDADAPNLAITQPAPNTAAQTGVTLQGTCETGLTVNLSGAGLAGPATTACNAGSFSVAILFTAGDGPKNIIASQTDGGGNTTSDNRTFIRDTTAPVIRITLPAANALVSNGSVLQGTCETGLTVQLSGAGHSAPASTACNAGAFSVALTFSAGDGNKNIVVTQTDAAGNLGTDNRTFLRDDTNPVITITAPAANTVAQTGVTLAGTCETGLIVNLSGAGLAGPATTTCNVGTYSVAITFTAGDGNKTIIASQTDAASNTGTATRTFIRDNTAPVISITNPAANAYVAASATITGVCETGLQVQLTGADLMAAVTTACAGGNYSGVVNFTAGDGSKTVTASQTDLAGNSGSASRSFLRDSSGPAVTITAPAANTVAQVGVTLTGTCENGLTVNLSGAGLAGPASTACAAGSFSVAITFTAGDGNKTIVASQTDSGGNTGSDSRVFVRDATAPNISINAPAANTVAQTGLTVSGNCETGLPVTLSGAGVSASISVACVAGNYTGAILFTNGDGNKEVRASQTDAVSNVGTATRNFIRDNTAPLVFITAPAANSLVAATATISGTCESGLTVLLNGAGLNSAVNTNCVGSAFSAVVTFSAGDGDKVVVATQTDAAGNTSSDTRTFRRDGSAPVVVITAPAANSVHRGTLNLQGTCESGLDVVITGQLASAVTTPCSASTFSAVITLSNGDGNKTVTARQTDSGGNTGSDSRTFINDMTAPLVRITAPAANTVAQTGVNLQGTCENGLPVQLSGAGLAGPASTVCNAGTFAVVISFTAGDGVKAITVTQTDGAGNIGTDSRNFVRDNTAPVVRITAPAAGTNAALGLTISGVCETGLLVNISGAVNAASTTACNAGAFSAAITFSANNGAKLITVSQTDLAGNTGTDSRSFNKVNNAGYDTFTSRGPGGKVDILFVDDNSASMDAEQIALGSRFSSFTTALSGLDWQAGIVTTDCTAGSPHNFCGQLFDFSGQAPGTYVLNPLLPGYLDSFRNTIQRPETLDCLLSGTCPSGREEGLKSTIEAINRRNTDNAGFFRADADLAVVMLTDEDEQSNAPATATTPAQVISAFNAAWGTTKKFSSYSIIVRPGDNACWSSQRSQLGNNANYGTYPDQLSQLTGGISVSICEPDYSVTLTDIGLNVTRLSKSVDLSQTPLAGSVRVVFTPAHTTTWSISGRRITFDVPAPMGTQIEIFYEY